MEQEQQGEKQSNRLSLEPVLEKQGLFTGTKSNGVTYSVRKDRRRYFYPEEWTNFINQIKDKKHRFFFITCLHTGGRIMEVLNLKHEDIDLERSTIKFTVVKQRKAKKNFFATGTSRSFFVASNFIKEYKSFIRNLTINPKDYLFLNKDKLPENYENLNNQEKKKYYSSAKVSYSNMMKRALKRALIPDWYNFSPHNIRKTYGMWMRTFNKEMGELCYRMGHDMDTYIAHYGSSLIFTDTERRNIERIFGEVK